MVQLEADHDNVFSCSDETIHNEKRAKMALGVCTIHFLLQTP